MPGSPTVYKGYALPTVFGDLNAWGSELNSNFNIIDANVGGMATIAVTGVTAAVSGTLLQNGGFKFTGSPAGACTVTFASYSGPMMVLNASSQSIVAGISGGQTATVPAGQLFPLWSDGLNFYKLTVGGGLVSGASNTTGTGAFVLTSGATVTSLIGVIPAGVMVPYAGITAPTTDWLVCNGAAVSRTTYANLFAVCGTAYGAGDGSSTFNVPDMRGRAPYGYDSGNATGRLTNSAGNGISAAAQGNSGGEQAHTLVTSELSIHAHGVTDPSHNHSINNPAHNHSLNDPGHGHGVYDPTHAHSIADPTHAHSIADPGHQHFGSGTYLVAGTANPFPSGPPTYQFNLDNGTGASGTGIGIYAAGTGIGIYGNYTGISIAGAGTGQTLNAAIQPSSANAAFTSISVNSAGGGGAHNTTPPGLVTGYLIHV